MNLPIVGLDVVRRELGDYRSHILSDGTMSRSWEANILGWVTLPEPLPLGWEPSVKVSRIRFHNKLCDSLEAVLKEIHALGLWRELKTFDGAYNFRAQRGSGSKPSAHCWAAAIDLAAAWNQQSERPTMHPGIVGVFEAAGYLWGGRWGHLGENTFWEPAGKCWRRPFELWGRCDGMHLQAVDFRVGEVEEGGIIPFPRTW